MDVRLRKEKKALMLTFSGKVEATTASDCEQQVAALAPVR